MKITIDSVICEKEGLTLGDILFLVTLKFNHNFEQSLNSLISKGLITRYGTPIGPISITQEGLDKIQDIICESTESVPKKRNLESLAEQLQQLYPTGKKDNFYWRGSLKDITTKLQRFFATYGNRWTDEQIINATKHYVDTHSNDPYMRLLKYFILKDGSSDLAEVLENMGQEESITSDWTTNNI